MEYEQLRGRRPHFGKQLTESDVNDRLVVTIKMARVMPRADPDHDIPIRVLDDEGDDYQFLLARRKGKSVKPFFKPRNWRAFIKKREAKPGDTIYFWPEVNEMKRTEYRINLIPFIYGVSPNPEGLGYSDPPSESSEEVRLALRAWAAHGLAL